MDRDRIERRKLGRAEAKAVLEMVYLPHPDCVDGFLDELKCHLRQAETAAEAKRQEKLLAELAHTQLKFGQYQGWSFERANDMDRGYLEWLKDQSQELADQLGEFLELTESD